MPHRILLVEPDVTQRNALWTALIGRGYAVLEAESVARALDCLGTDAAGVDLIVCACDTELPGLPGVELLRAAQACRPSLPLVGLAGTGADAEAVEDPALAGVRWLSKPVAFDQLCDAVAALLEAGALVEPGR